MVMVGGDISQIGYDQIHEICKRYSWGTSKHGKGPRDVSIKITKSFEGGSTHAKIDNLLKKIKTNILSSLSSQFDTL
jgi:hypothetical protein